MSWFYDMQPATAKSEYIALLRSIGALSNLFSENSAPYLHYRIMENIFCKAFDADNLSRSDVSVDAAKDGVGIGLKTFLHGKGNTLQKVAEFNQESNLFRQCNTPLELVQTASQLRNERIAFTHRTYGLTHSIYHVITRSPFRMAIYEELMVPIQVEEIVELKHSANTLRFRDNLHEYSFSLSKSTLYKRFLTTEENCIFPFSVEILKDPYDMLKSQTLPLVSPPSWEDALPQQTNLFTSGRWETIAPTQTQMPFIILPLYSPSSGEVHEKSGLNMWNAGGRARNENEVYLPIPRWIHEKNPDFFPYRTEGDPYKSEAFEVDLPNGKKLSMKVTQQGGKALQSDPNADLGQWILRDVLQVPPHHLVTKKRLDEIGIDSVQLTRKTSDTYALDFLKTGSFEEYREEMEEL